MSSFMAEIQTRDQLIERLGEPDSTVRMLSGAQMLFWEMGRQSYVKFILVVDFFPDGRVREYWVERH